MQLKQSSRYSGVAHLLVCVAVAAALPGTEASAAPAEPVPVRAIEQPGYVTAFEQVDLYSRITGYVEKVAVDLGDRVKSGDVLAKLAVPELEQQLKQKEARVLKAQTSITRAKLAAKVVATAQASEGRAEKKQRPAT